VIDGEIVIATDHGLDFRPWLRLHPAGSRVRMFAEQIPASFIVFDLLALDDDDYTGRPFSERRAALVDALAGTGPSIHVTPATADLATAKRWFDEFEGAGLDGLIAKPLAITYQPDKRVMFKIKHERTADCVVAGYRVHKSGDDAIGSLLLGLYKDDGTLASVGVIGAFPMAERRRLLTELQPLVTTFEEHPWNWAAHMAGDRTPRRNEGSRWNAGKDLSFVPLRPERVVEVRYDHMEGERFRRTAQFNRWRPDRDPRSCTYAQLEHPVTFVSATSFLNSAESVFDVTRCRRQKRATTRPWRPPGRWRPRRHLHRRRIGKPCTGGRAPDGDYTFVNGATTNTWTITTTATRSARAEDGVNLHRVGRGDQQVVGGLDRGTA
jgi:ATP-dependent DNA ligase